MAALGFDAFVLEFVVSQVRTRTAPLDEAALARIEAMGAWIATFPPGSNLGPRGLLTA